MRYEFAALGAGAKFRAPPFGSKANFDARGFGCDDACGLVRTRDDFDGSCGDTDGVAHAYEDTAKHTDTPNEKLKESRCALVECYGHRVEVEFEENSRCAFVMFDFAGVMGYAVLMSMERSRARRNVGRWDNVQEVLEGDEVFLLFSEIFKNNDRRTYFYRSPRRNCREVVQFRGSGAQMRIQ